MRADSFSHAYIAAWRSGLFILGFVFRIFFFVVLFGSVLERLAKRKKLRQSGWCRDSGDCGGVRYTELEPTRFKDFWRR
jgi:hypothetical protein